MVSMVGVVVRKELTLTKKKYRARQSFQGDVK